uniref:EGF-like domain-containing protein n=1 Tax=Haemonchus contortus TaxID=6289 RepID=A0A7I4YKC2_HAECO
MGGQAISFYDIHFINVHYQCYAACSGVVAAKCVNGGVANPRHCSTNCICPAGYAGALCNQRPPACGATLTATTAWVTRKVTVGDSTIANTSSTYKMCTDWVKAPAGKKIQIRVTALQGVNCTNGCWVHAIEPKIDTDKRLTNARICCPEQLKNILPSRINPTPIVFYSIRRAATFTYQYRYVTQ